MYLQREETLIWGLIFVVAIWTTLGLICTSSFPLLRCIAPFTLIATFSQQDYAQLLTNYVSGVTGHPRDFPIKQGHSAYLCSQ
jgi:hypothetical protein